MTERQRERQEMIERRCLALEVLGFRIDHEDRRVGLGEPMLEAMGSHSWEFRDFYIDFSAIAEDKFMGWAMQKIFEYGIEHGKTEIRDGLKTLLGMDGEGD